MELELTSWYTKKKKKKSHKKPKISLIILLHFHFLTHFHYFPSRKQTEKKELGLRCRLFKAALEHRGYERFALTRVLCLLSLIWDTGNDHQ